MKKTLSFVLVVSLLAMTCTTAFADAANPFSIFGTDDRKIVSSTSGSNYSICKIYIEYSDDTVGYGTGFLVDSNKVVTAGHALCYKSSKVDGQKVATRVVLYFGCSGTNNSYTAKKTVSQTCSAGNLYYPDEWENYYDMSYDYGVIKLDNPISTPSYLFPMRKCTVLSEGDTVTITGYEHHLKNTKFTNWQLIQGTGKITETDGNLLYTKIDAMAGQSGSPVIYDGEVIGIYTYSAPNADKNVYLYPDNSPLNNTITGLTLSAIREIEDF